MARSFLNWGVPVDKENIQRGDIVIFPRGNSSWKGHVGFFISKKIVNNTEYWLILGGNQKNQVRYDLYNSKRSIGIRRWTE